MTGPRQCILFLPKPPTANNLFPTGKHGKRFCSPEYTAWKLIANAALSRQPHCGFTHPVRTMYDYAWPLDRRRRDVFNLEKAVTDLLVDRGVLSDDSLIYEGTVRWSKEVTDGVRITIEDYI